MPDLEPITREEKLLDGEDLTPITRKEMFIKRIYDKTQEIPEPITREEYFLKKAGEGGGGDIDLQTLNVTENGTVIAPSGVAYNKVVTNVPSVLPENAYLLEEYEDVPTDIASFTASDAPLKSLTASIVPVQAGSGDPSPTNVRPISGWTEEVVARMGKNWFSEANPNKWIFSDGQLSDDEGSMTSQLITAKEGVNYVLSSSTIASALCICFYDKGMNLINRVAYTGVNNISATAPTNSCYLYASSFKSHNNLQLELGNQATSYEPYAGTTTIIPFTDGQGQSVTVYHGDIDIVNGILTDNADNNEKIVIDGVNEKVSGLWGATSNGCAVYKSMPVPRPKSVNVMCDKFKYSLQGYSDMPLYSYVGGSGVNTNWTFVLPATVTTKEEADAWFAENPTTIVYKKTTPVTYQQQPTSIKSLDGENNVFASTGQIETLEFFTKEAE